MKKLKATVTKKDGTTKDVYVVVDNKTAKMLDLLNDKNAVNDYLVEEYKMFMADRHEHLCTQSLDKSLDGGLELEDENQDLFEIVAQGLEAEKVHQAISQLDEEQQKIVYAMFFEGKTQVKIAENMNISKQALYQRLIVIKGQLKKFLKNF